MKITILGNGTIGSNNKTYFESLGHTVALYDPPQGLTELPIADLYVICTPSDVIADAVEDILQVDEMPKISIESTITEIGLTRRLYEQYLVPICYCPQRYWADDPDERGVKRERVFGVPHDGLSTTYWKIYAYDLQMPVQWVVLEAVEWGKLIENAYRGLQIAFAEEMKMLTGDLYTTIRYIMPDDGMHWLAEARDGIGGHCIPMAMDTIAQRSILMRWAIEMDKEYRKWLNTSS